MAPALELQQSPVRLGQDAEPQALLASRRCKVICSVGPACQDVSTLVRLIDAGMDACCVSFFNESQDAHAQTIQQIKEAAGLRPGKPVAIILDPRVPEMRTGLLACGGAVSLRAGSELRLVTDVSVKGDETRVAVSYRQLPSLVQPGATILCAEGSVVLEVLSCGPREVLTRVARDCRLGELRDVRLPGAPAAPSPPAHPQAALRDAAKFALAQEVDFITVSCARGVFDVRHVQDALGSEGHRVGILARIDSEVGLQQVDDVLREAHGLLVERSELAARLAPERALLAQKLLVARCMAAGKPVVVASQLLQSMARCPSPSRAEVADAVNAALDGADALLLSEASASDGFPEEAVAMACRACSSAAAVAEPLAAAPLAARGPVEEGSVEAVCRSALETAAKSRAKLLVVATESGRLARALASHRPRLPILAVTASRRTARALQVFRGVEPLLMDTASSSSSSSSCDPTSAVQLASSTAQRAGLLSPGDAMVAVHAAPGVDEDGEVSEGEVPAFQVHQVWAGDTTSPPRPRQATSSPPSSGTKVAQAKIALCGASGSPAKLPSSTEASAADSPSLGEGEDLAGGMQLQVVQKLGDPAAIVAAAVSAAATIGLEVAAAAASTLALPRLFATALAALLTGSAPQLFAPRKRASSAVEEASLRFFEENQTRAEVMSHPSGLQYKVLQKGSGAHHPEKDSACTCHFEGRLVRQWPDGDAFDSTFARKEPATLRPEELIAGWEQALLRMVEGDRWEVYIPAELGYGDQGSQPHVEPGEGLVFVIELLEILGDRRPLVRRASFDLSSTERLHLHLEEA